MQFKNIAIVLASGLVFAGCSLLPSSENGSPEVMMEDTQVEETKMEDETMMEETTEMMEDDDKSMVEPEAMMEDANHVKLVAENFIILFYIIFLLKVFNIYFTLLITYLI